MFVNSYNIFKWDDILQDLIIVGTDLRQQPFLPLSNKQDKTDPAVGEISSNNKVLSWSQKCEKSYSHVHGSNDTVFIKKMWKVNVHTKVDSADDGRGVGGVERNSRTRCYSFIFLLLLQLICILIHTLQLIFRLIFMILLQI